MTALPGLVAAARRDSLPPGLAAEAASAPV